MSDIIKCYICDRTFYADEGKKPFWNKTPGRLACVHCYEQKAEKRREYYRKYYEKNREDLLAASKQYIKDHPDRASRYNKKREISRINKLLSFTYPTVNERLDNDED